MRNYAYQLVLQWTGSALCDYDAMIALETEILELLEAGGRAVHCLDGHDMGDGEMNIFIHTNDPPRTLATIRAGGLLATGWSSDFRAAFRPGGRQERPDYTILYPSDLREFRIS
jgi:hypothetical protein